MGSILMDFHETSITGIILMRQLKWGAQSYANCNTACFVKYLGSMLMYFTWDFYNRDSFDETIEIRCNNPMLTSKLYVLLNIWTPFDGFSWDFYNRDSFDEMVERRGNNPMLTSKLYILLDTSAPCWSIFTRLL